MSEEFEREGIPGGMGSGDGRGDGPGSTAERFTEGEASRRESTPSERAADPGEEGRGNGEALSAPGLDPAAEAAAHASSDGLEIPKLTGRRPGRRLVKKTEGEGKTLGAEERLLLLDTWKRSGLSGPDFADLVGLSAHTLYVWQAKFEKVRRGVEGHARHDSGKGEPSRRLDRITFHAAARRPESLSGIYHETRQREGLDENGSDGRLCILPPEA